MQQQIPLINFIGIVPGRYIASEARFIVRDDPVALTFTVAVDDRQLAVSGSAAETPEAEIRSRYVTRLLRHRLHQAAFRERVLDTYRQHCAICRLHHHELLEAARIVADRDPRRAAHPTDSRWPGFRTLRLRERRFRHREDQRRETTVACRRIMALAPASGAEPRRPCCAP